MKIQYLFRNNIGQIFFEWAENLENNTLFV